jgi:MOSC domain-containing protein YiiM
MIGRFLRSGRSGFYFSVVQEGEVGVGDEFEFLQRETPSLTIAEMLRLYSSPSADIESLRRAVQVELLPDGWRDRFQARIDALQTANSI